MVEAGETMGGPAVVVEKLDFRGVWGVIIEPYLLGALLVVEVAFTFKGYAFTLITTLILV